MLTTMRYVLLVAMRDKLLLMLLIGLMAITAISHALSNTLLVEQQATALVFAAETSRILLVVGMLVFVIFHIRQAYDSREMDVMLSRPISRANLVIAYWLGFAIIALILAGLSVCTIGFLVPMNTQGFILWELSLVCELLLMAAFGLFTSLMLSSAVSSVITCIALYVLSRMMGFFLVTVNSRISIADTQLHALLQKTLNIISSVVPRLDFFTESSWLVYGTPKLLHDILFFGGQSLIFIPFLILATITDLNRRQF